MDKRIAIQLLDDQNGSIVGSLDLLEGSDMPFTKSVADIKDISKRKGTVSKSIKIAGNNNANNLLGHLYDVNIQNLTFDRNKKQNCRVVINDLVLLDNCTMQVMEIQRLQSDFRQNEKVIYTVNIKSEIVNLFKKLKDAELTDVKFTVQDIAGNDELIYTPELVKDSFDNKYSDGYKFALNSVIGNNASLTQFTPSIYLWTYFNRILKNAGFRYTFEEIGVENSVLINAGKDDLDFRKLLIPYVGEIPESSITEKAFYGVKTSSSGAQTLSGEDDILGGLSSTQKSTIQNDIVTVDDSLSYSSLKYISKFAGVISIHCDFFGDLEFVNNSGAGIQTKFNSYYGPIPTNVYYTVSVFKNGGTVPYIEQDVKLLYSFNQEGQIFATGSSPLSTESGECFFNLDALPNDVFEVKHSIRVDSFSNSIFKKQGENLNAENFFIRGKNIKTSAEYSVKINNGLSYGAILDFNNFIPKKVKQSEFIKSIFNLFNIYVDIDEDDSNLLILRTRDFYFDSGRKLDLTELLAKDKGSVLTFVSDTQKKNKVFTYKKIDKGLNKEYSDAYGEIYGEASFEFDNEFTEGEDKLELIFNPAPYFESNGFYLTDFSIKDSLLILIDGGNEFRNLNILGWSGAGGLSSNRYPLTLHVDNPISPTVDLNFGVNKGYFVSEFGITTNNIFNRFWRRTVHQLNSGIINKCYLNISDDLFADLKLNDSIYLVDKWYYINSINDFNTVKTNLTELELVSIDDFQSTVSGNVLNIGVATSVVLNQVPALPILAGNNIVSSEDGVIVSPADKVAGIGNIVSNETSFIIGNGNHIGGGQSFVIGDGLVSGKAGEIFSNGVNVLDMLYLIINKPDPTFENPYLVVKFSFYQDLLAGLSPDVFQNPFGVGVSIKRDSVGNYIIVFTQDIFVGNYEVQQSFNTSAGFNAEIKKRSDTELDLITTLNGAFSDAMFNDPSQSNILTIYKY